LECPSTSRCKHCNKAHHTLLHREIGGENSAKGVASKTDNSSKGNAEIPSKSTLTTMIVEPCALTSILPSAVVYVLYSSRMIKARILLDNCSEFNLISEEFIRKNKIFSFKNDVPITGINGEPITSDRVVKIKIKSRINNFSFAISANILPVIPYRIKGKQINAFTAKLSNLQLADQNLGHDPVDLILGVVYVNICLLGEKRFFKGTSISIENSVFGWVLSGGVEKIEQSHTQFCHLIANVEEQIRKFWEIEECDYVTKQSSEHVSCERHFLENVHRSTDGHFVVALPFK